VIRRKIIIFCLYLSFQVVRTFYVTIDGERTNCKDEEDSWKEQSSSDGDEVNVKWWLMVRLDESVC
jgi:hypothetical protein